MNSENNSNNGQANIKSLHLLYLLLNAFDIGFLVSDKKGSIIHSNSSLLKILGIPYEELYSKNINLFLEYLEKNFLVDLTNIEALKKLKDDENKNISLILSLKGNKFLKLTSSPLNAFNIPYRIWVFADYTEKISGGITIKVDSQTEIEKPSIEEILKSAQAKNSELEKKLNEITEKKISIEKFISVIAHDLKSPFQGLLGIFDIITETFDELTTEELKKYIGYAKSSVKNLYQLIDELLQWSRFLTGNIQFNPTKCNLYQEMVNVINLFKGSLDNKKLTVINYLKENLEAYADESMVNSIFRNLISNAIKYSRRGGTIIIDAIRSEGFIQISVADQGIGMEKEIQEKLFKIGEQVSMLGTENETGTGLGLILCKEMVELNGGKIWFESEPNKGSTFYITLPIAN